jgi:predicted dehydrogenase
LTNGIHVAVEKPMAMNLDEANAMASAARASGRVLSVAHSHLFDRSVMRAEELLRKGELGDLVSVQAMFFRGKLKPGKEWLTELPGGLAYDEMPHALYLLERFLGPLNVQSKFVEKRPGASTPKQIMVAVEGARASGLLCMVMEAPVSEWHLVIVGSRRVVVADLFRDILVEVPDDGEHTPVRVLRTSRAALLGHVAGVISSGIQYARGHLLYGHDVFAHRFVRAVQGTGEPPVPVDQSLRVQALADEILR